MGNRKIELSIHTGYTKGDLEKKIRKIVKTKEFTYRIDRKSLDARKKNSIKWVLSVVVTSPDSGRKYHPFRNLKYPGKKKREDYGSRQRSGRIFLRLHTAESRI